MSTSDTECSGRPVEVTIPEIIDKIRDMTIWKRVKLLHMHIIYRYWTV